MPLRLRHTDRELQLHARMVELEAANAALRAENEVLSTNFDYGCLSKQGLLVALQGVSIEGRACVYWDLDDLKLANSTWGQPAVNVRVKRALHIRPSDMVTGQVHSGDEFCAFPPADEAVAMAHRLLDALREQELSATFVVLYIRAGESALQAITRANGICEMYKATNQRNDVHIVQETVL